LCKYTSYLIVSPSIFISIILLRVASVPSPNLTFDLEGSVQNIDANGTPVIILTSTLVLHVKLSATD
jgi:hypothetical protein